MSVTNESIIRKYVIGIFAASMFFSMLSFAGAQSTTQSAGKSPKELLTAVIDAEKAVKDQEAKITLLLAKEPYETANEYADRKAVYDDGGILNSLKAKYNDDKKAFEADIYTVANDKVDLKFSTFNRETKEWTVSLKSLDLTCPFDDTKTINISGAKDLATEFAKIDELLQAKKLIGLIKYRYVYYMDGKYAVQVFLAEIRDSNTENTPIPSLNFFKPNFTFTSSESAKSILSYMNQVYVKGGVFGMGSTSGASNQKPMHEVRVSDFWIMNTEVMQKDYASLMGKNPSDYMGDYRPVENVSWYEAVAYANMLSQKDGLRAAYTISGTNVSCDFAANGWRLPTEAEWEYAARGGQSSRGNVYSGSNDINAVAWHKRNSGERTKQVGTKEANELGLFDMSGNVWEWCWDWYGKYSGGSQTNPLGAASGSLRVLRGGCWDYNSSNCSVASRDNVIPDYRSSDGGFRVLRPQF